MVLPYWFVTHGYMFDILNVILEITDCYIVENLLVYCCLLLHVLIIEFEFYIQKEAR